MLASCSNFPGGKNLRSQQQIQRATMVYKSLDGLASEYPSSKFERRETADNLRDQMFHCRAQTFIKIVLAIVAPFFGTVSLVTQGKQSPGGSLNAYSKEMYIRHGSRGKHLFYMIIFFIIILDTWGFR